MIALAAKAYHPAPLPQCPLTGQSGDSLKPNAPRLELTSKEDGRFPRAMVACSGITLYDYFELCVICLAFPSFASSVVEM